MVALSQDVPVSKCQAWLKELRLCVSRHGQGFLLGPQNLPEDAASIRPTPSSVLILCSPL